MQQLHTLNLNWTPIGNEGLKKLKTHRELEELFVYDTQITDAGLAELKSLGRLRSPQAHLERHHGQWPGAFVGNAADRNLVSELHASDRCRAEVFRGMPRLKYLYLNETAVTDAGAKELARLWGLTRLDLTNTQIGDEGIGYLAGLTRLEMLILNGTQVTNAGLAQIEPLKSLGYLGLAATAIDDDAWHTIARLQLLEVLDLNETQVTEAGLAAVEAMPKLHSLACAGRKYRHSVSRRFPRRGRNWKSSGE